MLRILLKLITPLFVIFFLMLTLPLRAEEQKVLLDLVINQNQQNPSLVILEGEKVWVKTQDLKSAGLENFTGEQKLIKGENYTAINSLNNILSYQINLEKFSLDLTVQTDYLKLNIIDLYQSNRPDNMIYTKDSSFFLNYSVGTIALSQLIVAGEMAWNWDNVLVYPVFRRLTQGTG